MADHHLLLDMTLVGICSFTEQNRLPPYIWSLLSSSRSGIKLLIIPIRTETMSMVFISVLQFELISLSHFKSQTSEFVKFTLLETSQFNNCIWPMQKFTAVLSCRYIDLFGGTFIASNLIPWLFVCLFHRKWGLFLIEPSRWNINWWTLTIVPFRAILFYFCRVTPLSNTRSRWRTAAQREHGEHSVYQGEKM